MGSVVKRFDVVAGRKYTKRDGSEATHWINCGEGAEWDDGGISIRLHAVPVGTWFDGSLKLFERRPREDRQSGAHHGAHQRTSAQPADDFGDSDIPF